MPIAVPRQVARFLAFAAVRRVPVALPEPLQFERVALSPSTILKLERPRSDYGASRTIGRVVFGYGEWRWALTSRRALVSTPMPVASCFATTPRSGARSSGVGFVLTVTPCLRPACS
jgi:hypothetical protein